MVPPPGGLLATSRDLERGKRDGLAGVSLLLRECTSIIKWISGLWETWQTKQPLLTSVQGGRRMCCTANELQPHPQPRLGKRAWHAKRQQAAEVANPVEQARGIRLVSRFILSHHDSGQSTMKGRMRCRRAVDWPTTNPSPGLGVQAKRTRVRPSCPSDVRAGQPARQVRAASHRLP